MPDQDISKQFDKLRNAFRKELRESVNDIRLDALYQQLLMQHVFKQPEPLAAMTTWSIAPEFAWWLYQYVTTARPEKIIELGSGTSTLVIAAALKQLGKGNFLSFEHDHAYYEKTRVLLQACDLQNHVELLYAPLEKLELAGDSYRWYDLPYDLIDHMIGRESLDLLLIDGPPAATNRHARYPAMLRLRDYCNDSTAVLLDDAGREEEQEILARWIELSGGKGTYQLLSNIRHGPALFYPSKQTVSLNICEDISMESVSELVGQEVEQLVERALSELPQDKNGELAKPLLDAFYRLRERSLHELKIKYSAVNGLCQALEKQVLSLQTELADAVVVGKQRLVERTALQDQLDKLTADRQQMSAQIEALEADLTAAHDAQAALEQGTAERQNQIATLETQRDEQLGVIEGLKGELVDALARVERAEHALEQGGSEWQASIAALQAERDEQLGVIEGLKGELVDALARVERAEHALEQGGSEWQASIAALQAERDEQLGVIEGLKGELVDALARVERAEHALEQGGSEWQASIAALQAERDEQLGVIEGLKGELVDALARVERAEHALEQGGSEWQASIAALQAERDEQLGVIEGLKVELADMQGRIERADLRENLTLEELQKLQEKLDASAVELDEAQAREFDLELRLQRVEAREVALLEELEAMEQRIGMRVQAATEFTVTSMQAQLDSAKRANEKLMRLAESAKKELDVAILDRNALKTELTALGKRYKQVYKSLVYQLGLAFYRQTRSAVSWAKMPLAIHRVMRRHAASGNPELVEYQEHLIPKFNELGLTQSAKKIDAAKSFDVRNCSRALQQTIKQVNAKNTLWIASQIAEEQGGAAAVQFAEQNDHENQCLGVNLLRANADLHFEEAWLSYLNAYLKPFELAPVSLSPGAGTRFSRLCVKESLTSADGPLVSVIMPAFNAEATLRLAAQSILSQTWRNLQLIIVDDCSFDATWEIAQQIAALDSRVLILRNAANVGPYVSKNLALRLAMGDYITGHDADDWAHPQRIEMQMRFTMSLSSKATLTRMLRIGLDGKFTSFSKQSILSPDGCRRTAYISCFFEADFLKNTLGGWDTVRFGADGEIIRRSEILLGQKLSVADCVSMFCLDLETGLTRHPQFGIQAGGGGTLSPVRKAYVTMWDEWHSQILLSPAAAFMPFPHRGEHYIPPLEMQVDPVNLSCTLDNAQPEIKKKILVFIYNDSFMRGVLNEDVVFDLDYFSSDRWPVRPNSTSRLNIANYQAARIAFPASEYDVKHVYFDSFSEAVLDGVKLADFVVVHQVASERSRAFVRDFCSYWMERDIPFKLIFGTEMSWGNDFSKGLFSKKVIDFVYREALLLRHTPKTDRFFYSLEEGGGGNVRELDLGVDTDLLSFGLPVENRKYITFVRAPEGRKFKNNELIDSLISSIRRSVVLGSYDIKVMEPPYSSVDYWKVMSESAFLVMTSDTETFSYVLNDARALGVIGYHPAHMYSCSFGWCEVDSYPDSPHKFLNEQDLISKMEFVSSSLELMAHESKRSRDYVVRNFSLSRLAQCWKELIEGGGASGLLFVVGENSIYRTLGELKLACRDLGVSCVVFYMNSFDFDFGGANAVYDEDSGITFVRYFLYKDGGVVRRVKGQAEAQESKIEMEIYFDLIKRMYRIGSIVYDDSLAGNQLFQ